jgi:4-amino-4-deoxy-L-arabinose transferase-like glycosyltransferase
MSKYRILFVLVAILLLTRVGALLFFIDDLFDGEELLHGTIAKEIMEGPDLPLLEYPPTNYGHGGFLSGILTIPFFALFGQNHFALQLTPVAFSAAILIILFLFAYKFFNRRVAIITGLLYLFSSRTWIIFNLHNGGLHFENIIFTVGAMYVFYEIIFNGKDKPVYYFSLGLISGFGTYWIYTFLVTLAAVLLLWFLRDKKMLLRKGFYIFLAGFLIGMFIWLVYNLQTQFKSITDIILDALFVDKNYLGFKTWLDTIGRFLMVACFSGMFSITGKDTIFGAVYLVIYWLSFLYILRLYKFSLARIISSKESFLLVFPVMLLISAAFYGFYVEELKDSTYFLNYRYIVSLFPFVFLTVAVVLDRLMLKFRILKGISIATLSIPIILGGFVYSKRIDFKNFGSGFNQLGYSYLLLSESFSSKYPHNFYKILDNITRLSAPEKYEVLTLPTTICPEGKIRPVDFKEYLKLSLRLDDKYKPIFYKILIKGLYSTSDLSLKDLVREVNILSKQVDDRYKPYLYQGIGALVAEGNLSDTTGYKDGANFLDEKYVAYYYRGLSESDFEDIADYIERFKSCMDWLDKQYQPFYLEGVGEHLAKIGVSYMIERVDTDGVLISNFFKILEPDQKGYILEGMGKSLSYFYSPNTEKDIQGFISTFSEEDKKDIRKAMMNNLKAGPADE